jgi:hypothetical protein
MAWPNWDPNLGVMAGFPEALVSGVFIIIIININIKIILILLIICRGSIFHFFGLKDNKSGYIQGYNRSMIADDDWRR